MDRKGKEWERRARRRKGKLGWKTAARGCVMEMIRNAENEHNNAVREGLGGRRETAGQTQHKDCLCKGPEGCYGEPKTEMVDRIEETKDDGEAEE